MTSIPGPPPDWGESQSQTVIQTLVPTQVSDQEEIAPSRSSSQPTIAQEKPTIPAKSEDIPSKIVERKAHEAADKDTHIALQARNGCPCPSNSEMSGGSGSAVKESSQAAPGLILTENDVREEIGSKLNKVNSSDDNSQGQCKIEDATMVKEPFAPAMEGQELSEPKVPTTIRKLPQATTGVEDRIGILEQELQALRGNKLESGAKDGEAEQLSKTVEVIPDSQRLVLADVEPSPTVKAPIAKPVAKQREEAPYLEFDIGHSIVKRELDADISTVDKPFDPITDISIDEFPERLTIRSKTPFEDVAEAF